jgi:crossover junction endodeoxyribonuclease RuvC
MEHLKGKEIMDIQTVVCGLDLSFTETGFSIITVGDETRISYGSIKTKKKDFICDIDRCVEINKQIFEVLNTYEPHLIIIEDTFSGPSATTTKKLTQLGAVVRAFLKTASIPYVDLNPKSLKKYVCDDGNATKQDIIDEINKVLDLDITNSNVADSLGLAMYGVKEVHDASVIFTNIIVDNE